MAEPRAFRFGQSGGLAAAQVGAEPELPALVQPALARWRLAGGCGGRESVLGAGSGMGKMG